MTADIIIFAGGEFELPEWIVGNIAVQERLSEFLPCLEITPNSVRLGSVLDELRCTNSCNILFPESKNYEVFTRVKSNMEIQMMIIIIGR